MTNIFYIVYKWVLNYMSVRNNSYLDKIVDKLLNDIKSYYLLSIGVSLLYYLLGINIYFLYLFIYIQIECVDFFL
jgi:hypothetical protein